VGDYAVLVKRCFLRVGRASNGAFGMLSYTGYREQAAA